MTPTLTTSDLLQAARTDERSPGALPMALAAAQVYTWEYDAATGQVVHSANAEEVLGFAMPKTVGEVCSLVHPEDLPAVAACLKAAGTQGQYVIEHRLLHPVTGAEVWVSVHGLALESGGGRLVGIARNVTVERLEDQRVRRQEERMRLAHEATGIGTWEYDIESGETYWSDEYRDLYGIGPDVPPNFSIGMGLVLAEDLPKVIRAWEHAVATSTEYRAEHRVMHPTRGLRWIQGLGRFASSDGGRKSRVVGMVIDITDRREAETASRQEKDLMQLAVEAGKLGIWDWDIRRNVVTWTDRVYELHGVAPGAFGGTVESFAALVHPDDVESVRAAIEAAVGTGAPFAVEFRVPLADGTPRWLATRAKVISDADGAPIRMVGATYDVTARMEMLEQTRQARHQAEAASRAKDEFLAMLGHELRNPLAPIVSALHLMEMRGSHAHAQERRIIERQVRHLSRLVDDLLDVSRVTRGKISLDLQSLDVRAVIRQAVEMTQPAYDGREVPLHLTLPDEPAFVDGDFVRLAQVVANLLTNAAKFTPSRKSIGLEVGVTQAHVAITVHDQGCGIEPDVLPRVFDLFVQGAQTPDRRQGGLGLGLALVRALVQLHGGSVEAQSPGPGEGSTFTVLLPRSTEARASPSIEEQPPRYSTGRGRILVVDDNIDAAQSLADMLELAGYQSAWCASGREAIALVAEFAPDVAILDIGLPDMSGYELAARLRSMSDKRLATVALTGFGQEADRAKSAESGMVKHLVKPVLPEVLFPTIEALMVGTLSETPLPPG